MFRSHHFRRHVVESLEARRLLSTVSVYEWEYGELYVADGVSGQWSGSSQSDPRMTSAQPTVSLTVSGLPAHVRLIVSFGFESAYGNDSEDTETVSWAISDGPSDEWTFGPDYSSDGAHFTPNFAHSEDEFTLTLMASDQETFDYANPYSVFVSVVTPPTVSVSGGGTRAEDGSSATFTVSRDGNASLWSESLTVDLDTTGSTASPADYTTSSTGYEPVPSSVTIPAGLGSTTFTARPLHDSEDEQTETLGVAVAPSANYPVGGSPAQLVITDVVRSKQAVPVLFYHFEEVLTADLKLHRVHLDHAVDAVDAGRARCVTWSGSASTGTSCTG